MGLRGDNVRAASVILTTAIQRTEYHWPQNGEAFMAKKLSIVTLIVGVAALSVPLFAHHGAASFDTSKMVTVTGTVTEYVWANPHVLVKVDARDDSGNITRWVLEAWNPVTQASRGWTKNTFKFGDDVRLEINPAKNGQPVGEIRGRIVINGKEFKESL
jgi:Family of unknown function (DUF6152)